MDRQLCRNALVFWSSLQPWFLRLDHSEVLSCLPAAPYYDSLGVEWDQVQGLSFESENFLSCIHGKQANLTLTK